MLLKWFWRPMNYLWAIKCTNTHTGNDTLSHFVCHRLDVFHCQSQRMHKFLSQHDSGVIVITTGDPGRTPTVSGASCKRRVVIQFPLRFLRGFQHLAWPWVFESFRETYLGIRSRLHFRRACHRLSSSPESWGCLTSFMKN